MKRELSSLRGMPLKLHQGQILKLQSVPYIHGNAPKIQQTSDISKEKTMWCIWECLSNVHESLGSIPSGAHIKMDGGVLGQSGGGGRKIRSSRFVFVCFFDFCFSEKGLLFFYIL